MSGAAGNNNRYTGNETGAQIARPFLVNLIRSSPRKRGPRTTAPDFAIWIPAFAGMSGSETASVAVSQWRGHSRMSTKCPAIAAAAAIDGDTRCVRPL